MLVVFALCLWHVSAGENVYRYRYYASRYGRCEEGADRRGNPGNRSGAGER